MFSLIPINRRRDISGGPSVIDRFFDDPLFRAFDETVEASGSWVPPVEVSESDNELVFTVEVPGLTEKDIKLNVENQVLTFGGERLDERQEGTTRLRTERRYGKFSRSFRLPETAQVEKISASMKNGILTITVPKREDARRRRIDVEVQ